MIKADREKDVLHPRNKHNKKYDLENLSKIYSNLEKFIILNKYNEQSIDFANADAVKALNTALLKSEYNIDFWEFPKENLCPPIPGRADYIHYLADLLFDNKELKIAKKPKINCLDIGTGASCIYPIIGSVEYGWYFVASDIDEESIKSASKIVNQNKILKQNIEFRLQENPKKIFSGIIKPKEFYEFSICNPPFHKSKAEAMQGSRRKLDNLNITDKESLNFAGISNELWCKGGEKMFIKRMIKESKQFGKSCRWFTSLVAKREHLNSFYDALKKVNAKKVKTIDMAQGNKKSRILAWTFLD